MSAARFLRFPVRLAVHTRNGFVEPLKALFAHRGLFVLLLRRDLADRTSGTVFGFSWLLVQPALQMLAFWFLLELVLQVRFPGRVGFLDYFLIGMLPWLLMSEAIQRSTAVLNDLSALYRRMAFPIVLLPLLPLVMAGAIFGTVYVFLAGLLAGPAAALLAPLIVAALIVWLLPIAFLVSVLGLFVRDFRQFLPFVLTMVMYLTPILYMPQMLPEAMRGFMVLNPVADLIAIAHHLILDLPATPGNWLRPWVLWALLLGPSWVIFNRAQPHMREAL